MAVRKADVVILGGGISGLASAFYLRNTGCAHKKIVVLEGSPRTGGWINSYVSPDGAVHERGTRSMRPVGIVGRNTLDLVSAIGLEDEIVAVSRSHPASQNRFIYTERGLHRLPSSLRGVVRRQDPFSQSLLARLLREPFAARCKDDDESIHDFFSRRLGKELAEYLASPFCRGIFAGDSKQLSMRACFPAIFNAERKHGSIIAGGLLSKPEKFPDIGTSALVQRAKDERWATWSMRRGLQTLPDRLSDWLLQQGVEVHTNTPCSRIELSAEVGETTDQVAKVILEDGVLETKHVICTTPSHVTQRILSPEHSRLSGLLGQIRSATVAVVNLEYEALQLPVNGFGYLVPSSVTSDILGVVFDSCTFPDLDGSSKKPTTRLTCMMGGAWFNEVLGDPYKVDPDDILHSALKTINRQIGISQKPVYSQVNVHHDCIPQYRLGHTQLVDDIQSYVAERHLPITLLGASYRGVSVNDCIFQARQAVKALQT